MFNNTAVGISRLAARANPSASRTVFSASVTSASPLSVGTRITSALVIATAAARLPNPAVSTITTSASPATLSIKCASRVSSVSACVSNAGPSYALRAHRVNACVGSASNATTRLPSAASEPASNIAIVVFPGPPFELAIVNTGTSAPTL